MTEVLVACVYILWLCSTSIVHYTSMHI